MFSAAIKPAQMKKRKKAFWIIKRTFSSLQKLFFSWLLKCRFPTSLWQRDKSGTRKKKKEKNAPSARRYRVMVAATTVLSRESRLCCARFKQSCAKVAKQNHVNRSAHTCGEHHFANCHNLSSARSRNDFMVLIEWRGENWIIKE